MAKHILDTVGNGRWHISGGEPVEDIKYFCVVCGKENPPEEEECDGDDYYEPENDFPYDYFA